jgi:hypothetical protein
LRSRAISTTFAGRADADGGGETGSLLGVELGGALGGTDADGLGVLTGRELAVAVGVATGAAELDAGGDVDGLGFDVTSGWATAMAYTLPPEPLPLETTTRGRSPADAPKTESGLATGPIGRLSSGLAVSQPGVVGPQTWVNPRWFSWSVPSVCVR